MSSGERPMGAAKGKQPNTEALCQPPPDPRVTEQQPDPLPSLMHVSRTSDRPSSPGVQLEDLIMLMLPYKLNCQTPYHITRDEWLTGWPCMKYAVPGTRTARGVVCSGAGLGASVEGPQGARWGRGAQRLSKCAELRPLPARPGAKSDVQKCVRRGPRPLPAGPGAKSDAVCTSRLGARTGLGVSERQCLHCLSHATGNRMFGR